MLQVSMSDVLERPEAVVKAYEKLWDISHKIEHDRLSKLIEDIVRETRVIREDLATEDARRLLRILGGVS